MQRGRVLNTWLCGQPCQMLEYLTMHCRGTCDGIVAWDGGMRKARRMLEDSLSDLPAAAEVFIVYKSAWNAWVKRKIFLSSETTECGYICMPASRTKHGVQARESGINAAGEETSHWTTFTGLVPPARLSLPRLSAEDKAKVFPKVPGPLPPKWLEAVPSGVPMFWGETKPVIMWENLIPELRAGYVIDLSPGSGMLASACMSAGVQYVGLVSNPNYLTWLTNVLDREALKYICRSGSFLYQEELAKLVEELFADAVESNPCPDDSIQHNDNDAT